MWSDKAWYEIVIDSWFLNWLLLTTQGNEQQNGLLDIPFGHVNSYEATT